MKFLEKTILIVLVLVNFSICLNETEIIFENPLEKEIHEIMKKKTQFGVFESMLKSFMITFISEIGDKTFILCTIYSTKLSHIAMLVVAFLALTLMNIFSIFLGFFAPIILYQKLFDLIAIYVFIVISYQLIEEANKLNHYNPLLHLESRKSINPADNTDLNNLENNTPLLVQDKEYNDNQLIYIQDFYNELREGSKYKAKTLFWSFFTSLVVAECCDRSQISIILLSSVMDIYGVFIGTSFGLLLCLVSAIYVGAFISEYLSLKMINYMRACLLFTLSLQMIFYKLDFI